jgi:hypothetical protein
VYSNGRAFQLELMDAYSLEELASYDLAPRSWSWILQGVLPWEYLGAGMYFYLDHQDRAVVPTTTHTIQVVEVRDREGGSEFVPVREYDLAEHVVPMPWPKEDSVAWVLPEWSGRAGSYLAPSSPAVTALRSASFWRRLPGSSTEWATIPAAPTAWFTAALRAAL